MKTNWSHRFVKYLKKVYFRNDKRVAAYFVCVAIATGFWFLNALSKTYTVEVMAPVQFTNLPDNKTLASNLPEQFELTIRARGFTILRQKLGFLIAPLEFDVNDQTSNRMMDSKKTNFVFPTKQFMADLSHQLSNDLEILTMNPDTLSFRFDKMGQKRVKVNPIVKINLKRQFQIAGNIKTIPDSVMVNGPQSTLDTLKFIDTEIYQFNEIDKTIEESVKINPAKELYFDPKTVQLNIPVEEYTEAEQSVPVVLVNKPNDVRIKLFPSKVKVTFLVGLSRFSEIHPEDIKLTVSYSDILEGKQLLKIKNVSIPAYLYDFKISPEEIEYLIEN